MTIILRRLAAALTLFGSTIAMAAAPVVQAPYGAVNPVAVAFGAKGAAATLVDASHPLPTGGKQEAFQLAASNTASAAATAYGGDYIFAQTCSAYGTVALQVLGPNGSTYQTILSKTATDAAGGTGLALGSNAVVRVTLTGTTGCSATLSRVP